MNLAFFLTPVADVACLSTDMSVSGAIAALTHHGYTAVPVVDPDGCYVGTLTVGDLLRHLTAGHEGADESNLSDIGRRSEVRAVGVDTDIRGLLAAAADQNFVPVVDSRGVLMGIVTRRAILTFFERLLKEHGLLPPDTSPLER